MRRRTAAIRLLGLLVRIWPGACTFFSFESLCCIDGGLCDVPILDSGGPTKCVCVCVCVCDQVQPSTPIMSRYKRLD